MLVDKDTQALEKVSPKLKIPAMLPSTNFTANVNLGFSSESGEIDAPAITSRIADIFNQEWESRRFSDAVGKKNIDDKAPLAKISLDSRDKSRKVQVDIPALNAGPNDADVVLKGTVTVEIFHKKGDSIENVNTKVQNALRDRLTQRVFKGELNSDGGAWNLAPTYLVHFWEIPLSVTFSLKREKLECEVFLNSMLQRLKYIYAQSLQKDPQLKTQMTQTVSDLVNLAKKYDLPGQQDQLKQAAADFHL
jgi:hypothetical protein